MAELSYSDVQRAVRECLGNLNSDIARLNSSLLGLSSLSQSIDEINRSVTRLGGEIIKVERFQQQSSVIDQRLIGLMSDFQEMKLRVANVERMCNEMNIYLRHKQQQELEEAQFRSSDPSQT